MFETALQALVAETRADLAIFCDYEGEAIALALAGTGADSYEARVLGAHLAAPVIELQRIAAGHGATGRLSFGCVAAERTLLAEALPGGYYVVLALPARSAGEPFARRQLRHVADRFATEL